MSLTFPALDFPVYGLTEWTGPKWLDDAAGELGQPVWSVWLAHGNPTSAPPVPPWVRVATLPKTRIHPMPDEVPAQAVAYSALHVLINLTAPELTADQRKAYWLKAVHMTKNEAMDYAEWPRAVWTVDGRQVRAHVFSWAGVWAAFTTEVPDVALIVIAAGLPPEGIRLSRITTGADYHFELDLPLRWGESFRESALAAEIPCSEPQSASWPIHPDQQRLINP